MSLNKDKGFITSDGIKFRNKNYTCSLAIKEQWFEKAWIYGPTHVDVYFDSEDYTEIVLLMNVGFVHCTSIDNITWPNKDEYYRTFQQLRQTRSRNKK